jgi:hypothetical protein
VLRRQRADLAVIRRSAHLSDDFDAVDESSEQGFPESTDRPEGRLWREYDHLTALYRFYVEMALKVLLAFFLIAGTVTTLVVANTDEQPAIDWALIPLAGFSGVLAIGLARSSRLVQELEHRIDELAKDLGVGLAPHVSVLRSAIEGLAVLAGVTFLLLIVLLAVLRAR